MKAFVYRGIHYLVPEDEKLSREDFIWDGESYPVGSIFSRIGSNGRQSLNVGWNLIYVGMLESFVLFTHDAYSGKVKTIQLDLFNLEKPRAFIAIGYLDQYNLFMPSGVGTSYDIVP